MSEHLPINLFVSNELSKQLPQLLVRLEQLTAKVNLRTLMAHWYADESACLTINFHLQTYTDFALEASESAKVKAKSYADDVNCSYDQAKHHIDCAIAFNQNELQMLNLKQKLISPLLLLKLEKVLNIIAKEYHLPQLN